MTAEAHIGPHPPHHRCNWDCQCARCGSSCYSECCDRCGGEGFYIREDVDDFEDQDDFMKCDECGGEAVTYLCPSSPEWCEANPLTGREKVERGQIEWFEDRYEQMLDEME